MNGGKTVQSDKLVLTDHQLWIRLLLTLALMVALICIMSKTGIPFIGQCSYGYLDIRNPVTAWCTVTILYAIAGCPLEMSIAKTNGKSPVWLTIKWVLTVVEANVVFFILLRIGSWFFL